MYINIVANDIRMVLCNYVGYIYSLDILEMQSQLRALRNNVRVDDSANNSAKNPPSMSCSMSDVTLITKCVLTEGPLM